MLQLKKKVFIFIFLALLFVTIGIWFVFLEKKEMLIFSNTENDFGQLSQIGIIKAINSEFALVDINNSDLTSRLKYIEKKIIFDHDVELFRESKTVKSDQQFFSEQDEFNKTDRLKNVNAPSWFELETIVFLDIKIGDVVKIYYKSDPDSVVTKMVVEKQLERSEQYENLSSNRLLGVDGLVLELNGENNEIIILIKNERFNGETEELIIRLDDKTKYYFKKSKSEQVFSAENEEFLKKLASTNVPEELIAPEWFIFEKTNFSSIVIDHDISIEYKQKKEWSEVVADTIYIMK